MRQKSLQFCPVYSGNWKKGIIKITLLNLILLGLFGQLNAQISVNIEYTSQQCSTFGTADATAQVFGGTPPYSYQWSNGATTQAIYGLGVGTYSVTVTDASTTVGSDTKNLVAPPELVLTLEGADGNCYQGNNDLTAIVSGGVPPYNYQWSNGSSSQVVYSPTTGYYFVTVTDANGCFKVDGKAVSEPMQAVLVGNGVTCVDACDGSVTATVTGGQGPFTYFWDNGNYPNSAIQVVADVGIYNITITDANGCTTTGQTAVTSPPPVEVSITLDNPCDGTTSGTVQATGGTPPYTYFWSNGHLGQTHSYLTTGQHTVTVTDANDCKQEAIAYVAPSDMAIAVAAQEADCFGGSTGAATLNMTGGSGTAEYLWSNGQTGPQATGLTPGTYSVTATDVASGCERYETFEIETSTGLELTTFPEMIDCDGNGGVTNVSVLGGNAPYTFEWSDGQNTQAAVDMQPGEYTVMVSDVNGCTGEALVQMEEMNTIEASMMSVVPSMCDSEGGSAMVSATGGAAPYTFEWNGQFIAEPTKENLAPGMNTVIVHDANGCKETIEFEIIDESMELMAEVTSEGCPGMENATVQAHVMGGGEAPYTYQWNNGETTQISENMPVGVHIVTVTDANGCAETVNIEVAPVPEMAIVVDIIPTACGGAATGAATAEVMSGGVGPYSFAWSNASTSAAVGGLTMGQHTLMVTDANGCQKEVIIDVQEEPLELSVSIEAPDCADAADGVAQAAIMSGGTAPYAYNWSTGSTGAIANNLPVGIHTLEVTDANGCNELFEFEIAPTSTLAAEFNYGTIDCNDDGVQLAFTDMSTSVSQGTTPVSWFWSFSDGQTSNEQNPEIWATTPNLTVELTVTDALGCSNVMAAALEVNPIDVSVASEVLGCEGNELQIEAIVNNGADDLVFTWSPANMILAGNGTPNPTIATNQLGEFSLSVSIQNSTGCSVENVVMLSVEEVVPMSINSIGYAQCNSLEVDFLNANTADVECIWYFDYPNNMDASSTLAEPSYTYTEPGNYTVALVPLEDCHEPLYMDIVVETAPVLEIDAVADNCQSEVLIQFTDMSVVSGGIQNWSWDFGPLGTSNLPNPQLTVTETQDIQATLTVEFSGGCTETIATTVPVNIFAPPTLDDNWFSCTGQSVELNPNGTNDTYNYQWSVQGNASLDNVNAVNPTATLTQTTTFTATITDANGSCESIQEVTVEVPETILLMQPLPDVELCDEVEVTLTANTVGASNIQWATDADFTNIVSNEAVLNVMAGEPTTYYVIATSDDGCTVTQNAVVGNYSSDIEFAEQVSVCEHFPMEWNNTSIDPANITGWLPYNPLEVPSSASESFTFTMDVGEDCPAKGTFDLQVIPFDFEFNITAESSNLLEGEFTNLVTTNNPTFIYNWSPATGLSATDIYNPVAQPLSSTTYIVDVTDTETNCSGRAEIEIEVKDAICDEPYIFVPNAFTPNEDGKNDVLYVRGVNLDEIYFAVYDRWGEMVFETDDLEKGWDGKINGNTVSGDVYGYYLKAVCYGGQQFFKKGNVSVLR